MRIHRITSFLSCLTIVVGLLGVSQARAQQRDPQEDIWEEEPTTPPPWWQRWLDDQNMDRIMKGIQQRDPAKAKELAELRKKNIDEFKEELVQQGRQEVEQISRESHEARRQKDQAEFVEWLKTNYPQDANALSKMKEKDPSLYIKTFDRLRGQYSPIFDASKTNPELASLLKENLDLRKRSAQLIAKYREEKSSEKKKELVSQLRDIVSRRYDLIVRRKEMGYEQLQKKVQDLQKQIGSSQVEIRKWKDPGTKQKNIEQHMDALIEGKVPFKWD
jgi:hypothetical protein